MNGSVRYSSAEIDQAAAKWIARRDAGWTAAERAECERWRAADVRHAQALAKYDDAWVLFDRPRAMGGADAMWHELGVRAQRRRHRIRLALATAAALVVAGFVAQIPQPWRTAAPPSGNRAIVRTPEKRTFADGSVVELRSDARIAVDFASTLRKVTLHQGEAHFQIVPDPTRPFVVTAGGVNVRAVGTAFSVQLGMEEIEVLVTAGRIAVEKPPAAAIVNPMSHPTPAAATPLAMVDAGNRIRVNLTAGQSQTAAVSEAELAERLAWRAPRLEFSGTPLVEVVELLNRHSRVQLALEPGLATVELSGIFRADNTEAFLRVLEATFGITAERSGNLVVLRPAR